MKKCPQCGREYDNSMMFCLDDGIELLYGPASMDGPATAILSEPGGTATGVPRDELPVRRVATGQQDIRFCTTDDGVRLAYSVIGAGPLLVRVLGHFTHLEAEWEWPDLRHFWERLAEKFTVVRYDGRGIGLSDRYTGEFTEDTRQLDLETVLDQVGAENTTLLGISEGGWTAAAYSNRHPERVTRLVLYGAYSRGRRRAPLTMRRKMRR